MGELLPGPPNLFLKKYILCFDKFSLKISKCPHDPGLELICKAEIDFCYINWPSIPTPCMGEDLVSFFNEHKRNTLHRRIVGTWKSVFTSHPASCSNTLRGSACSQIYLASRSSRYLSDFCRGVAAHISSHYKSLLSNYFVSSH